MCRDGESSVSQELVKLLDDRFQRVYITIGGCSVGHNPANDYCRSIVFMSVP